MLSETIQRWKMEFQEKGLRKGLKQGLKKGRAQGLRDGEARLLTRLLEKRFGELPERVRYRIQRASQEQLEAWAERALDAHDLDTVITLRDRRQRVPASR